MAAISACVGENTSVTLTWCPSLDSVLHAFTPSLAERHLDDDVLVDGGQLAAFPNHALGVGRHDLGADRALHQIADRLERRTRVAAFLRHQRRVRGDAVDDPERNKGLDLLDVAGIDEQLHASTSMSGRDRPR